MLRVSETRDFRAIRAPRSRLMPKRVVRAGIVLQMRFYRASREIPFIHIKTRASALSSTAITNRDIDKNT